MVDTTLLFVGKENDTVRLKNSWYDQWTCGDYYLTNQQWVFFLFCTFLLFLKERTDRGDGVGSVGESWEEDIQLRCVMSVTEEHGKMRFLWQE